MAMFAILLMGYKFEILNSVIPFLPILVIWFFAFWSFAAKCSHDKNMHIGLNTLASLIEKAKASIVCTFSNWFNKHWERSFSAKPRSNTAYVSHVTDFIKTFKTHYCFPVFHSLTVSQMVENV